MTNIDPHINIQSVTRFIIICGLRLIDGIIHGHVILWFIINIIMVWRLRRAVSRRDWSAIPLSPTVLTGFDYSDIDFSRFPSTLSYRRPAVVVVSFICPRENRFDGLRLCPMEPINSTAKSRMLPGEFCVGRKTKE